MGFFDSLYDTEGNEWQTKALGRGMSRFHIGDAIPSRPIDHQVKVLGDGPGERGFRYAYATIRDGRLAAVPEVRDMRLPLLDYNGTWIGGSPSRGSSMHEGTER